MTKQKIVYICHPIGGDVEGNLAKLCEIIQNINENEPDVIPFVPYFADVVAMDDNDPKDRRRGTQNALAVIRRKIADECRVYGEHLTHGIFDELQQFILLDTPIIGMNEVIREKIADMLQIDIQDN